MPGWTTGKSYYSDPSQQKENAVLYAYCDLSKPLTPADELSTLLVAKNTRLSLYVFSVIIY